MSSESSEYTVSLGTLAIQDLLPAFMRTLLTRDPDAYLKVAFVPVPSYALQDGCDPWWEGEMANDLLVNTTSALVRTSPPGMFFGARSVGSDVFGFWSIN